MRYASRVAGVVVGLLVVLGAGSSAWAHGKKDPPKRVLILVVDQFRPDYVDKFDMRNVRALMRDGVNFDNAYLGHMASETVITHNVITSGQLPKDMGWADEAFRDTENVLGEGPGSMWTSGSLTREQFNDLIAHEGYWKLADYLKAAHPGTKFITAGQKNYAVYSANGPTGDIAVTFSSRNANCDGATEQQLARADRPQRADLHLGAVLRPVLRQLLDGAHLRHRRRAGLDVPARRQPLRGRPRPRAPGRRRLDRRRRHGDDGARAVERHAPHARLGRQGEPHVGRHHR